MHLCMPCKQCPLQDACIGPESRWLIRLTKGPVGQVQTLTIRRARRTALISQCTLLCSVPVWCKAWRMFMTTGDAVYHRGHLERLRTCRWVRMTGVVMQACERAALAPLLALWVRQHA